MVFGVHTPTKGDRPGVPARPIAVFDIDGTVFRSSLLIEITNALIEAELFSPDTRQIYAQQYEAWLNRTGSYQDYLDNVVAAYAQNVTGLQSSAVAAVAAGVIGRMKQQTYRYTRDLLTQLRSTHLLFAISGSPLELVELFCKHYGFTDFSATKYEVVNGIYTGKAAVGTVNKQGKLAELVAKHGASFTGSIAVGDTEGDIGLLSAVQHPIAFNPSSGLFAEATKQGWQVVVERKDVIYHPRHGMGAIS